MPTPRDAASALMTEPNNELIAYLILPPSDHGAQIIFVLLPGIFLVCTWQRIIPVPAIEKKNLRVQGLPGVWGSQRRFPLIRSAILHRIY